ncbi:MAG: polysaccharide deacetylase family protein [Halorientalis sp.]
MTEPTGTFTLSLDTELAWGTFDVDRFEHHESAYRATPTVVDRLCELFDEYQIPATWALVSHLLVDCEGDHTDRAAPNFAWIDDWFGSMPCATGLDESLWYAPWLLDRLRDCGTDQEIGLHGATHMPLGATGCSRQNATEELEVAVETLRDRGVDPESFVFPRNDVGHLDVLADAGIRTYRSQDAHWYERPSVPGAVRPPLRFATEATRRSPPVVEPTVTDDLVAIPGSQIFRPSHGGWQYTPSGSGVARAERGLERAAKTGGVFHLWFHPFNLGYDPSRDFDRLESILTMARELADSGAIACRPMREVGALARRGQWD